MGAPARGDDARRSTSGCCAGNFFLEWRDYDDTELRIPAGHGCFLPSRWAHWLSHPGDVPVVSFEVGFWTAESIRARKVYDVNWVLRRAGLNPKDPGAGNDDLKRKRLRRHQHDHAQGHPVPGRLGD